MTWNDDTPRKRHTRGQTIMLLAAALLIAALAVALLYSVPANGQDLPPMPPPIIVTLQPIPTPTITPDDVVIFTSFVYLPEVRK